MTNKNWGRIDSRILPISCWPILLIIVGRRFILTSVWFGYFWSIYWLVLSMSLYPDQEGLSNDWCHIVYHCHDVTCGLDISNRGFCPEAPANKILIIFLKSVRLGKLNSMGIAISQIYRIIRTVSTSWRCLPGKNHFNTISPGWKRSHVRASTSDILYANQKGPLMWGLYKS